MNTYEWIRQKCRNGAKFLLIYGIFVVMVYLAAEPADRTGEGLAGAGLDIILCRKGDHSNSDISGIQIYQQ